MNDDDDTDDELVWHHVIATVTPLPGRRPPSIHLPRAPRRSPSGQIPFDPKSPVAPRDNIALAGLDGRTAERLRRGLLPIDGRLDLHGLTQDAAWRRLRDFIGRGHAGGRRCLLIITGKGGDGGAAGAWYDTPKGVLRARLPEWLAASDLAPMILRVHPAQPRHGGDGAFYVLLRRHRA